MKCFFWVLKKSAFCLCLFPLYSIYTVDVVPYIPTHLYLWLFLGQFIAINIWTIWKALQLPQKSIPYPNSGWVIDWFVVHITAEILYVFLDFMFLVVLRVTTAEQRPYSMYSLSDNCYAIPCCIALSHKFSLSVEGPRVCTNSGKWSLKTSIVLQLVFAQYIICTAVYSI